MCMPNDTDEMLILKHQGQVMDAVLDAFMPIKTAKPGGPVCPITPKEYPLLVDLEIALRLNGSQKEHWLVADVYGTIEGRDMPATRDQPAEGRCIDDMRVMVGREDIADMLPEDMREQIEDLILQPRS